MHSVSRPRRKSPVIQSARGKRLMTLALFVTLGPCGMVRAADGDTGPSHLMYVGTLDHKLLVFDEDKEAVVGEIQLGGVPRTTVLSADQKTLYIVNTKMTIEIVDLTA